MNRVCRQPMAPVFRHDRVSHRGLFHQAHEEPAKANDRPPIPQDDGPRTQHAIPVLRHQRLDPAGLRDLAQPDGIPRL
jgi:hypothetical protein